jgi:hypothetical protein
MKLDRDRVNTSSVTASRDTFSSKEKAFRSAVRSGYGIPDSAKAAAPGRR